MRRLMQAEFEVALQAMKGAFSAIWCKKRSGARHVVCELVDRLDPGEWLDPHSQPLAKPSGLCGHSGASAAAERASVHGGSARPGPSCPGASPAGPGERWVRRCRTCRGSPRRGRNRIPRPRATRGPDRSACPV